MAVLAAKRLGEDVGTHAASKHENLHPGNFEGLGDHELKQCGFSRPDDTENGAVADVAHMPVESKRCLSFGGGIEQRRRAGRIHWIGVVKMPGPNRPHRRQIAQVHGRHGWLPAIAKTVARLESPPGFYCVEVLDSGVEAMIDKFSAHELRHRVGGLGVVVCDDHTEREKYLSYDIRFDLAGGLVSVKRHVHGMLIEILR